MNLNRLRSRCSFLACVLALIATHSSQAADPVLLKGHSEVVYDAAFLPDGKSVVTASFDRTLKLWDLATLKPIRTMEGHTGIVLTVAVSADGNLIASGSNDNPLDGVRHGNSAGRLHEPLAPSCRREDQAAR